MKFIGNYFHIIPKGLIDFLLENSGQPRPQNLPKGKIDDYKRYNDAENAGYNLNNVYWSIFEKEDVSIDIIPTWTTGKTHWWITKLMPGNIMPIHEDPKTLNTDCKRYWIPLQDYQSGHVFIISDKLITNYKAGDTFVYDFAQELHGAANISYTPRFVLQVIEYL